MFIFMCHVHTHTRTHTHHLSGQVESQPTAVDRLCAYKPALSEHRHEIDADMNKNRDTLWNVNTNVTADKHKHALCNHQKKALSTVESMIQGGPRTSWPSIRYQ